MPEIDDVGMRVVAALNQECKNISKRSRIPDQNFKRRSRYILAAAIGPSFADAHRLAPDIADSPRTWVEAATRPTKSHERRAGRKTIEEARSVPGTVPGTTITLQDRAVRRMRDDEYSAPCPARATLKHGLYRDFAARVLHSSKNQTFVAIGLQKKRVARWLDADGKKRQGPADPERMSRTALYLRNRPSKSNSIRASRFDKQACAKCHVRNLDGPELARLLYNEWAFDPDSMLPPVPDINDVNIGWDEVDEKADSIETFLPSPSRMSDIVRRHTEPNQPGQDNNRRLNCIKACWKRLLPAQVHYIHGRRQKHCVGWLVDHLPPNSIAIVRDLAENFRTGSARVTPSHMHTRHGLDEIYTQCWIKRSPEGRITYFIFQRLYK